MLAPRGLGFFTDTPPIHPDTATPPWCSRLLWRGRQIFRKGGDTVRDYK